MSAVIETFKALREISGPPVAMAFDVIGIAIVAEGFGEDYDIVDGDPVSCEQDVFGDDVVIRFRPLTAQYARDLVPRFRLFADEGIHQFTRGGCWFTVDEPRSLGRRGTKR